MKRILWLTLCSEAHPCQVGLLWERQWFSVYDLSSLAPEMEQLYAKGLISIKPVPDDIITNKLNQFENTKHKHWEESFDFTCSFP